MHICIYIFTSHSDLGKHIPLKTLSLYGIVTDSSLELLKESLSHIKINFSFFSTIARPTTGHKRNRDIWGIKCKLSLNRTDCWQERNLCPRYPETWIDRIFTLWSTVRSISKPNLTVFMDKDLLNIPGMMLMCRVTHTARLIFTKSV